MKLNQGFFLGTATTIIPSGGTSIWEQDTFILTRDDGDDSAELTVATSSPGITDILVVSGFGFNIPTEATLNGIEVRMRASSNDVNSFFNVQLGDGTTALGTPKVRLLPDGNFNILIQGNRTDLWGTALTIPDINSSTFSVHIYSTAFSTIPTYVGLADWLDVKIHYTLDFLPPRYHTITTQRKFISELPYEGEVGKI